ncbi:hypothetical protein ABE473_06325 [Stenotrophomonas sp. TWI700]|uniref:hypothetical protein n=1 Tax=Stenotrophomonas sp. TWI700 TaxID=3136792 RepID=UPI0032080F9C
MQARKLTLVEIGVGALPSASPVAPRFSTWFPVPFKAPDVPPANGVTPTPVADGVVLEWDAVDLEGVIYVISRSETKDGPWTEIHRTTETRYVYNDGSGSTWWFQITPTVRGKTGTGTVVGVTPPTTSTDLAEQQAKLAAEVSARIQAIADEAAARAAGLAQAAQDLVAEALLRQQGVGEAMQAIGAEAQARIDAILNEKMAREAAITREEQLRQSADESLARAVSEVAAGSGTQFDSIKLWPFNQTTEGWTGNGAPTLVDGWLRPANHATAPWVQSPVALAIDGSAYRFVKLRVRRVGAPTWGGFLQWITATDQAWNTQKRASIPEPAWDVNGMATVDVQDVAWWPAKVDAIRLQLGAAQTVANYYLIDYIAVGRPQPGASVALVQEETQARITADAAEASQRTALAVQMRGNYTGTDPAQLTSGIAYEELRARVAADSAQVQRISTMEARMPAGSGSLATTASVTALQESTATTTNALAQSITSINASLQNIGGDNLLTDSGFEASTGTTTLLPNWQTNTSQSFTVGYGASPLAGSSRFLSLSGSLSTVSAYFGVEPVNANRPKVTAGEKYVQSVWARGTPGAKLRFITQYVNSQSGQAVTTLQQDFVLTDTFQRFVGSPTEAPATGTYARVIYRLLAVAGGLGAVQMDLDNAQFQQGEVATQWSGSTNELQSAINATASAVSGLTSTVSQLGSTVDSQSAQIIALRSEVTDVASNTSANTTALQQLSTRTTAVEGRVDSAATNVTRLQSQMGTVLSGDDSLFPYGTFEFGIDGQVYATAAGGNVFTYKANAARTGRLGMNIETAAANGSNADAYFGEFTAVGAERRFYVEYWARMRDDSATPATGQITVGWMSQAANSSTGSRNWPGLGRSFASLAQNKGQWVKNSGYLTTRADAEKWQLWVSIPNNGRTAGVKVDLDDIRIVDVTEAFNAQQAADGAATALQGLTTRVTQAEGKIDAQATQVTELNSTVLSTVNRGESLVENPTFDYGIQLWLPGGLGGGSTVTHVVGGGQQGNALMITRPASATASPFIFSNNGRWAPVKLGKPQRRLRVTFVARGLDGAMEVTVRTRVRDASGEGNNDQKVQVTTAWARYTVTVPIGDARNEFMLQLWTPTTGRLIFDRIEMFDITEEVAIDAQATAISGLDTKVTQQGNQITATANSITALNTRLGDFNSAAWQQMQSTVTQQGSQISAQASQIQGVQASLGGKADAAVVQSMQVQVRNQGEGGNLIPNSTFPNWSGTGWGQPSAWYPYGNHAGPGFIPHGFASALCTRRSGTIPANDMQWSIMVNNVPAVAGKMYCIAVGANTHRCAMLFYAEFMRADGTILGSVACQEVVSTGRSAGPLNEFPRYFGIQVAPAGTAFMRVAIRLRGTGEGDPYMWLWQPMLCQVSDGATQPPPYAVSGQSAEAQWAVDVRADGKVGGVRLGVTGQEAVFDIVADRFRVSPSGGGERTEYSDGNWRVYDGNGVLRVAMGVNI